MLAPKNGRPTASVFLLPPPLLSAQRLGRAPRSDAKPPHTAPERKARLKRPAKREHTRFDSRPPRAIPERKAQLKRCALKELALNAPQNSVPKAAFRLYTPHPSRSNPTLTNPQIQWISFLNPLFHFFTTLYSICRAITYSFIITDLEYFRAVNFKPKISTICTIHAKFKQYNFGRGLFRPV